MADSGQNRLLGAKHRATANIARFDVDGVFCDYHKLDNRVDTGE
jgi:hypothetical protein